ncbi:ferredoxin reductase family protein [Nitrogeniibacter aestuarii]|uniref:ferredoxin reductase family protein n=1 Tax=Nitrogeniibacter aestuarii TaxID=2815343 RepID=UPI001E477206|nr:ferredoxin reductase family protein [Nitrogeniibacter aestuarii]
MKPSRWTLPVVVVGLIAVPLWWAWPGFAVGWRGAGIVLGWLGYGFIFASLVCMMREPRLARWFGGLERMYAWHHVLGVWAYVFLLAHPLALAADWLPDAPDYAWSVLSPARQDLAGWLGWAALLCLMAGLGSALSARLSYSAWRWLHGLLALSVPLGLAHLVALGITDWLLWMPVLALGVLLWRVLRSDVGLGALPHVVSAVSRPARDIVELTLKPMARGVRARPGQFILVAFFEGPRFRGCHEYHPFTLTHIAPDGSLKIGIKALGDCTRHIQSIEPGVAARVQGAFGDFGAVEADKPAVWLAGGIGIAPFLALLRASPPARPVTLIYLYQSPADAAFVAELEALARQHAGVSLQTVVADGGPPDLDAILPASEVLVGRECLLCGPPALVSAAVHVLQSRGVPAGCIHYERFDFR